MQRKVKMYVPLGDVPVGTIISEKHFESLCKSHSRELSFAQLFGIQIVGTLLYPPFIVSTAQFGNGKIPQIYHFEGKDSKDKAVYQAAFVLDLDLQVTTYDTLNAVPGFTAIWNEKELEAFLSQFGTFSEKNGVKEMIIEMAMPCGNPECECNDKDLSTFLNQFHETINGGRVVRSDADTKATKTEAREDFAKPLVAADEIFEPQRLYKSAASARKAEIIEEHELMEACMRHFGSEKIGNVLLDLVRVSRSNKIIKNN